MWHHFLGIQEKMFGDDRKEMITAYRKIASLHLECGNPMNAGKYFDKVQKLMEKFAEDDSNMTAEEKKETLEEQATIYFQQYLTANQAGETAQAIEFI